MPFPQELPKEVADAGQLVAQFRFEDTKKSEEFFFMTFDDVGFFRFFHARRNNPSLRETKDELILFGQYTLTTRSVEDMVEYAAHYREIWKNELYITLMEGEILTDTVGGKRLSRTCQREQKFTDACIYMGSKRHSLISSQESSMPLRTILSRSAWMAIHYPKHDSK